jgi:hypothetical protein
MRLFPWSGGIAMFVVKPSWSGSLWEGYVYAQILASSLAVKDLNRPPAVMMTFYSLFWSQG